MQKNIRYIFAFRVPLVIQDAACTISVSVQRQFGNPYQLLVHSQRHDSAELQSEFQQQLKQEAVIVNY